MTDDQQSQEGVRTVKRTVTVPVDIAKYIDDQPNRSAYVTSALRRSIAVEQLETLFKARGIAVDPARVAKLRERFTVTELARAAQDHAA